MSCKCNNCEKIFFYDEDLTHLKDWDETFSWCDVCKTDWHLVDIQCIYCENNQESTHFICEKCGVWMCDDCYDLIKEHTWHYHRICDDDELEDKDKIIKYIGCEPEYICEECLNKAINIS